MGLLQRRDTTGRRWVGDAGSQRDRTKVEHTAVGGASKNALDYVNPTLQRIFGRIEQTRGAGSPLIAALRDFQIQLTIRLNQKLKQKILQLYT